MKKFVYVAIKYWRFDLSLHKKCLRHLCHYGRKHEIRAMAEDLEMEKKPHFFIGLYGNSANVFSSTEYIRDVKT